MARTYTTDIVHLANQGEDDEVEITATVKYTVSRAVSASFASPAYGGEVEILDVKVTSPIPAGWTDAEAADLVEAGLDTSELIADASDRDAYEAECAADYRREMQREDAR